MNFKYDYHQNEYIPTCHLQHKEDHYLATVEMPGTEKMDIDISFSADDGGISVKIKEELRYFIPLQSSIDHEGIEAKLDLGILTITIPKLDTSHQIKIK